MYTFCITAILVILTYCVTFFLHILANCHYDFCNLLSPQRAQVTPESWSCSDHDAGHFRTIFFAR